MTEETVTKAAIRGLTTIGWRVLAFDYPQSGSTFRLKRVGSSANTIIPDIVAAKGDTVIIVETKVHLDRSDHQKLIALRDEWGLYAESLDVVLPPGEMDCVRFGQCCACGPAAASTQGSDFQLDFLMCVTEDHVLRIVIGSLTP